jgi:hypothetical protein
MHEVSSNHVKQNRKDRIVIGRKASIEKYDVERKAEFIFKDIFFILGIQLCRL